MIDLPRIFLLTLTLGLAALPLDAGTLADGAAKAEAFLAAGDSGKALAEMSGLYAETWDKAQELTITDAELVTEPSQGYGIFNPRPDSRFKQGEPVVIYAEPTGFGYGAAGDGLYAIGFIVDLRVITEGGEVLGDLPNVTELDQVSRRKIREFSANITYSLSGIAPGRYILQTRLRDKNSTRSGTFDLTIEIVE